MLKTKQIVPRSLRFSDDVFTSLDAPYRHVTFILHPASLLPSLPRLLLLSQIDRNLCPYDPAATMLYFPSLLTNKLKQFKYNHKHKR